VSSVALTLSIWPPAATAGDDYATVSSLHRFNADDAMFLGEPPASETTTAAYAADREADGYISNITRLWCWRPDLDASFNALRASVMGSSELTEREWAVLVSSAVAERNDSYCSLAWGPRLAKLTDDETAAQVIAGVPAPALSDREAALAAWARQVVRDPNSTTSDQVARLREVGLGDREVFEATALVGFRLAFSTINDALGAAPDRQLADAAPDPIRAAVSFGRAPSSAESPS
jgi:uncharacterized peroxidase-related enzyme